MKINLKKWKFFITTSRIFPWIEKLLSYPMERREFFKKNGYKLRLKNPETLNEKIVCKKIRDRNPLLPITADKYIVKNFLAKSFGQEWVKKHVIPTLFYGIELGNIDVKLPEEYIVKGTHLSGRNLIKTKEMYISNTQLDTHIKKILNGHHWYNNEWLYSKITPGFIIEPLQRDELNEIPQDFKFICIHGKVELIQLYSNRHNDPTRSLFDKFGNFIKSRSMFQEGPTELPVENLFEVKQFVEALTFNLDFVRVDIYIIRKVPIFGELTHYPGSGHSPMDYNLDLALGRLWDLKK